MSKITCIVCCVRCTKWVPIVFLMSVMSWAYYAYIYQLCYLNVEELPKQILYILFFHVFLLMFLWSYAMTIFTHPARPTDEFFLEQADVFQLEVAQNDTTVKLILEKKAKELPVLTRTHNMLIRYCDKCKCVKPDRSHHCSACRQCVLKMDHHCPWVNNCVGYSNYKFFILFLFYAFLLCGYTACTSFEYFIEFWNEIKNFLPGRFHLLFLFFVSIMFAISVFSLLAYHIYLISRNCTTLESFRSPVFHASGQSDAYGFNLSMRENFKQIFGNNFFTAILPIKTQLTDGENFSRLTNFLGLVGCDDENDMSKVTVIGNGWGRSRNIYEAGIIPVTPELGRKLDRSLLVRDSSHYITVDSDEEMEKIDSNEESCGGSSDGLNENNNAVSFSNINTILKRNPSIMIRTIIADGLFQNNDGERIASSNDGLAYPESERQKLERQQNQNALTPPHPVRSSDALLNSDNTFQQRSLNQSLNNDSSINIMME